MNVHYGHEYIRILKNAYFLESNEHSYNIDYVK